MKKELENWGHFFAVFNCIVAAILFIVALCIHQYLLLIICPLLVVAGLLLLSLFSGFAELVYNSEKTNVHLTNIENQNKIILQSIGNVSDSKTNEVDCAQVNDENVAFNEEINEGIEVDCQPSEDDPDYMVCPVCGCRQQSDRTVCWSCGAKFIK